MFEGALLAVDDAIVVQIAAQYNEHLARIMKSQCNAPNIPYRVLVFPKLRERLELT